MRNSLLLLGLLLVPLVGAQGVEEWHQHIRTESTTLTGALPSAPFTFDRPHNWTNETGQSVFLVKAHYVLEGSGVATRHVRLTLLVDGVAACDWELSTHAAAVRSNANVVLECPVPFLAEGEHTTQITSAQVGASLVSPIIDATTSITLRQTETINMDVTITTALDFWLPFLFWVVTLLYALYSDHMLLAGFSVIGLLVEILPGLPGDFTQWVVFALLALVLEYFYGKTKAGEPT